MPDADTLAAMPQPLSGAQLVIMAAIELLVLVSLIDACMSGGKE